MTYRSKQISNLPKLVEISEQTAVAWLATKAVTVTSLGEENTYYVDQFDNRFYCKNYP